MRSSAVRRSLAVVAFAVASAALLVATDGGGNPENEVYVGGAGECASDRPSSECAAAANAAAGGKESSGASAPPEERSRRRQRRRRSIVEGDACVDDEPSDGWCDGRASAGLCEADREVTLAKCRLSCHVCLPKREIQSERDFGVDQEVNTPPARAALRRSVAYMRDAVFSDPSYAPVRRTCRNKHKLCTFWSSIGECDINPGYLRRNCGPACGSCEELDYRRRCPLDPDAEDAAGPGDLGRMFIRIAGGEEFRKYGATVLSHPKGAASHAMKVAPEALTDGPWILTFDSFLADDECDALIAHGERIGFQPSTVGLAGGYAEDDYRTSSTALCREADCLDDPVVKGAMGRIADVTGVPRNNAEIVQLLKYEVGQFYKVHDDYIEAQKWRPPGVRILTFFLYLNDVEEGGETAFSELNITVKPKKGRAVLWSNVLDEDPNEMDERLYHEAKEVIKGVKHGANVWLHMRDMVGPMRRDCHE